MTNQELFDFVQQEVRNNPNSFLSEFEPFMLSDIGEASNRFGIPVEDIEKELADNGQKEGDDVIVFTGEYIYSTTMERWAKSVRINLRSLAEED